MMSYVIQLRHAWQAAVRITCGLSVKQCMIQAFHLEFALTEAEGSKPNIPGEQTHVCHN
jgi:hypothetical protein